jgi:ABC-type branched-subunit amino acid transport system substrate-binding protein
MTHSKDPLPLFHKTKAAAEAWGAEPQPLYTAPPQRKPLTEEEIKPLVQRAMKYYGYAPEKYGLTASAGFVVLARAIERAHGIGGDE